MNVKVIKEGPLYRFEGYCDFEETGIELFASDLRNAEIGDMWTCWDSDEGEKWKVTVKIVYKDDTGCSLIRINDGVGAVESMWIEIH